MGIYDDLIPEKKKKKEEELTSSPASSADYGIYSDLIGKQTKKVETTVEPPKKGFVEKAKDFVGGLFGKKKEETTTPEITLDQVKTPVTFKLDTKSPIYELASFDEQKVAGASARIPRPGEPLEPRTAVLTPIEKATAAGIGDVIAGTGKVVRWMGNDGLADKLIKKGGEMGKEFEDLGGDWKDMHNPKFWVGQVAKGAPFTIAMLPLAFIGAEAGLVSATAIGLGTLGKAILTVVGGTVLSTAVESAYEGGSTYDEALNEGKSKAEANKAAQNTMKGNVGLLAFTNSLQFIPFAKPFVKTGATVEKSLLKTGAKVLLTTTGEAASEGFEEAAQKNISLVSQGKAQDWLSKDTQLEFALGSLQGLVFTAGGTIIDKATGKDMTADVTEIGMERNKQAINEVQDRITNEVPGVKEEIDQKVAAGVPADQATSEVLNKTAETKQEEVKKIIQEVFLQKLEEDKVGETAQPEAQIEPSVVQIVDTKTNKVEFQTIPAGQLVEFNKVIDDTQTGIAGEEIDGKVYHLTAKTPVEMEATGAVFTGEAKLESIPKSAKLVGNERQTDNGAGTNIDQGQPANIVRNGTEEQTPTGEAAKIPSGEVARGVNKVSDISPRERLTARIKEEIPAEAKLLDDLRVNQLLNKSPDREYGIEVANVGETVKDTSNDNVLKVLRFYTEPKFKRLVAETKNITTGEKEIIPTAYSGIGSSIFIPVRTEEKEEEKPPEEIVEPVKPNTIETLQTELTAPVEAEAVKDLTENFAGEIKDKAVETAFVNKWRQKAIEHTIPVQVTAREQVEINKEIEDLVAQGKDFYTEEEKDLLRQYSGAGGLEKAGAEGRGLLDEYFTPKPIVDFMWGKVSKLGIGTSDVLEPAAGIGVFLEGAPQASTKIAFEINKTSADIAKILYPTASINVKPFESFFMDERGNKIPVKETFGLVIGNPPYGEHRGRYLGLGEEPRFVKYEEYFLKRALDVTKKDGIVAMVIPSGFISNFRGATKELIAEQGYLEDAYRLPNGVFGTTTIGTDVVIFRKQPTKDQDVVRERAEDFSNDSYFEDNPDKILGEISKGTGNYGKDEVKGTLENAMQLAEGRASKVTDEIPADEVVEVRAEQQKEVKEAEEAVKSPEAPPENRVPMSSEAKKINAKAQIVPNKKYGKQKLNTADRVALEMWSNVAVTGELSSAYTANFEPKSFVNRDIAISIENGVTNYYPNILYYQGNIYEKLDNLELMKSKISEKQYEIQREGLMKVLPVRQSLVETNLQPIADFVKELKIENGLSLVDKFRAYLRTLPWEAFGGSSSWEVEGYLHGSVVNEGDKLQNIQVRKRRRDTGNSLFKRFLATELTADQKKFLEERFNRNFNAYYRPDYKQVPIIADISDTFNPKGESGKHPLEVKAIQKEGAAFLATKGAGLLAYDVGVGKTMTGIIAINEVMKRGWAKRPLVVVPNGTYQNWVNEISEIIPGVKINSLMNLGAAFKGDLKTMEIEDGTLSIITYDGLVKLGFKEETYANLTNDLRDVMLGMNNTKRAAEKEGAEVDKQIGRAIKGTTDQRFFEDLGFDHITIDEVHNFKNIFAGAKLDRGTGNEFRNVRGSSSARGIKAYLMAQYVLKNNNNRNVFLLSATPFTNSPLEIYSILSLMGKKRLENLGLKNVNDFMTMFMELKPTFQVKANQEVKEEDVIEKFQNLQQLQKLVTEYIDFRTGEEAGIDRPGREKKTITLSQNPLQVDYTLKAQPLFNDRKNGGAIVAITELQNITLSPYLSRFNEGAFDYKEFVENSPKIKYAVEAVTQTLRDNPDAGQVIYMPRGVEEFPLITEYLIKEKKFKPGQIAEITGGMNIDAKQRIMQAFNKGTVKILLGTEAIKEGVNLQERSTDLYHLHLPWNPTDMLQVEGRIWRQGNMWANVRIHYPLIENSVDSFIFQKLETKEKRIKNLWSYKDREINVGDLNFEEMKLDLITDPVIRVNAEKSFETKKENTKLEQLKVEKSFTENKIIKIMEADKELKMRQDYLKEAQADTTNTPDTIAYYQKKVVKAEDEVAMWTRDLKAKGIDVEDLKTKSDAIQKQIDLQQKTVEGINDIFRAKEEKAKTEKAELTVKENNFYALMKDIATQNKTFFVKRAGYKEVLSANANEKAPGGTASLGGYADVSSLQKSVDDIKAVPFPELLRLVRELTGSVPSLKPFKKALGRFYGEGKGQIKLNPEIFTDPKLSVKVFAHEVGHLFDFLPEGTLTRGNIIGRLHSLNKFLRGQFGEGEVTNLDIRTELKDLSQLWKPFDELRNPAFTQYRYSSKELYADAVSVLLNDPALLKEKAPKFYKEFFDLVDNKSEVAEALSQTWLLLNKPEEEIIEARLKDLDRMFAGGEEKNLARELEKKKNKFDFLYHIQTMFDNKNTPINRKVKEAIKSGVNISDATNPMFSLQNLNYMDSKIKSFLIDTYQPAYEEAQKVAGGWEQVGKILLLERAINERGDMANPGGFDPTEATRTLAGLEKRTDPEDWAILQKSKELFRKAVQATVTLAEKNGYYTPELLEQMKANKVYATYQVVDYMDEEINAKIYKSVGTLKDVANPATSTTMKAIATLQAIERNNARKDTVSMFQKDFPKEITEAKTFYNGKFNEPINPMDRDLGMVTVVEQGKMRGYYLEKSVAETLHFVSNSTIRAANTVFRYITLAPLYRPVFTSMNLGFQTFNLVRDFFRYWKNTPDKTFKDAVFSLPRAFQRYGQAIAPSKARALGQQNAIIDAMEKLQVLGLTYNDAFVLEEEGGRKQIERTMQKAGLEPTPVRKGLKILGHYPMRPVFQLLEYIELAGNFIETLPKVAGYIEMKDKLEPRELAYFLRTKVGSPDFRTTGTLTGVTNSIFLFSNAIKEGMKSDYQVATNPKTALGFWWKTALVSLLPKAIMAALIAGIGGDWLKKFFEDVGEYDKTNYGIVPLGRDENGKPVYLRVPQDETGRFLGGLFWKSLNIGKGDKDFNGLVADIGNVFDFGAGQLPNTTPAWTGVGALLQYFSGKNPYDSFRNRYVIPDKEFKAGMDYSFPIFFDWFVKQQGLSIVLPGYKPTGKTTDLQNFLRFPVLSNIVGRWIKVSDVGQKEALSQVGAEQDRIKARESLQREEAVQKAVDEYNAGEPSMSRKWEISRNLVKDVIGTPRTSDQKTKATNLKKAFKIALMKGKADPNIDALIYANTNDEKVQLLGTISKNMTGEEFNKFARMMISEEVMSQEVLTRFRKGQK